MSKLILMNVLHPDKEEKFLAISETVSNSRTNPVRPFSYNSRTAPFDILLVSVSTESKLRQINARKECYECYDYVLPSVKQ